jgi:hypothetical protein
MVEELRDAPPSNGHGEWTEMPARSSDAPYAALTGAFAALLFLASRPGRRGAETARLGPSDLVCVGLASQDIARVISRDRIAVFLRAPFAAGEAAQYPRGEGMRRAVGELLTCPHCLSLWIAAGLCAGYVRFPRGARFVAGVFAGHAVATASAAIAERLVPR